ncbi:GntR family transcriptional regulator [Streptomyces fuscigenes]|uniref:GntR family transcriptional regulator n=1 Tax=Streptomyces fuscigenes TaxID=1528880 RepID=UPI001F21DA81|nr:GntR family transcriptional regulator [Streptomyces fuscigenes]MCF3960139.1 GntR family transcriptional regulator [Streptomyces fuscigenes]
MSLGPVHTPTKSEVAYEALLRAIRTGELAPGQRVVLASLAQQLEMSQTPVRDALSLLAEQGLVVRRPNHVTVIGGNSAERSSEVSMLRSILEPEAAMLAAMRADPGDVADIAAACDAMDRALAETGPAGTGDLNARFHLAVARAGGSPLLADFVARAWRQMPLEGLTASGRLARAAQEHRDVLAAIEAGDRDAARALMAEHVGRAAQATEDYLRRASPDGGLVRDRLRDPSSGFRS